LFPALVADRAREFPDRVFLEEVGGKSWTYSEYHDFALRWAEALRRVGVTAGDRVVTMLSPSAAASCAWLGISWLRAIEVPCNTAFRGRMLGYLVDNSGAETIVIEDRFLDRLSEVADDLKTVRTVVVLGADHGAVVLPCQPVEEADFFAGLGPAEDLVPPEHSDICAMLYTSGTTGPSKGVLLPWGQLYQQVVNFDLDDHDCIYLPFPMHHITGRTPLHVMAISNGRIVVRERFETAAFWEDIDRYGCTVAIMMGPMLPFVWQQEPRDDDADHPLEKVWTVPLVPYVDEFKERFGGVRVSTFFGSTEQGPAIFMRDASSALWKSCGRLREGFPGYEVRVVDEHDYEVGPGEVGEVIVRSSEPWTMSTGYFEMPEKTAEAWRNGWYHTGDAFMYDEDGNYYFVDRAKDCIRRRGENISSFEVEFEVNAHPAVSESAAIGVPSDVTEEEVKVVVVCKPGAELTPEELMEFLIPRMPRFMVPRYVEFVDDLPKTEATLRVKKYQLRENALNEKTWDRQLANVEVPK
jgi:crotonobetaine/carnitine-CoA ligase